MFRITPQPDENPDSLHLLLPLHNNATQHVTTLAKVTTAHCFAIRRLHASVLAPLCSCSALHGKFPASLQAPCLITSSLPQYKVWHRMCMPHVWLTNGSACMQHSRKSTIKLSHLPASCAIASVKLNRPDSSDAANDSAPLSQHIVCCHGCTVTASKLKCMQCTCHWQRHAELCHRLPERTQLCERTCAERLMTSLCAIRKQRPSCNQLNAKLTTAG